ncbi:hypothetical protein ACFLVX_03475 [Chloroflexota bacterium]
MARPTTIRPGYFVAVALTPRTAPRNSYVGVVGDVDEYGIRINLVHWDEELEAVVPEVEDVFAPWVSITSVLVYTSKEPSRRFVVDKAMAWQADIDSMCTEA